MKKITVQSSKGTYPVLIGSLLLEKTGRILKDLDLCGKVMIVTQRSIAKYYLAKVQKSLKAAGFQVEVHFTAEGEPAKSEKEFFKILRHLAQAGLERRDLLIGLGGGVVGDLTGFAASAYLRGISFINIPTTLLAQVDSAIGGKTGINLPEGKNLAGAFYPPKAVISDITTLRTLPDRELRASLAEVVKCGVIRDEKLFSFLEKNAEKILKKDPACLEKIVAASAAIKAGVVSRDEHETKGERMILNFGHTYGHGLEQASGYKKLLHGEAVAIGMVLVSDLATRLRIFLEEDLLRLIMLLKIFRLPISAQGLNLKSRDILNAMSRDKKKKAGQLRFVLPVGIGKVIVRSEISPALVEEILGQYGVKK